MRTRDRDAVVAFLSEHRALADPLMKFEEKAKAIFGDALVGITLEAYTDVDGVLCALVQLNKSLSMAESIPKLVELYRYWDKTAKKKLREKVFLSVAWTIK